MTIPVEEQLDSGLRHVARVFFTTEKGIVTEMRGLHLQNHLNNVALLAQQWNFQAAFGDQPLPLALDDTHHWLIAAAQRHDEGKKRHFWIEQNKDKNSFTYSFRGHRFDVNDEHLYVQWLIRLHHGFSVDDVTQAQALLHQSSDPCLSRVARCFPLDLYALEMCDQIEAEAASRAFSHAGSLRVFMEFECTEVPGDVGCTRMCVFPYPFALPELRFTMTSFVVLVPPEVPQNGPALKTWLLKKGSVIREESKEIVLCKRV